MGELSEMGCEDLADVAAELALGVLTGRARAQAIAHLEQCGACRDHVRRLAITAEELLALLPSSEPPAGFETRVMSRLGSAGRHGRRWPGRWPGSRWLLATANGTILATACFSATR
jgi:anti-sigma-K factor RskA